MSLKNHPEHVAKVVAPDNYNIFRIADGHNYAVEDVEYFGEYIGKPATHDVTSLTVLGYLDMLPVYTQLIIVNTCQFCPISQNFLRHTTNTGYESETF